MEDAVEGLEHRLGDSGMDQEEEDDEGADEGVPKDRELAFNCAVTETRRGNQQGQG